MFAVRSAVRRSVPLVARRALSTSSTARASNAKLLLAGGIATSALLVAATQIKPLFAEAEVEAEVPVASELPSTTTTNSSSSESETGSQQESSSVKKEVVLEPEYQYVIIGAGTAAYAAVKAIQSREPSAKILVIGDEVYAPYMRPPLSKELWATGAENVAETLEFTDWQGRRTHVFYDMQSEHVTLLLGHKVTGLDVPDHQVTVDDGRTVKYHKCLVATGGKPRTLPVVPEAVRDKVSTYRTIDDFKRLDAISRRGGRIVVVGGSFLGTEMAYALASAGQSRGASVVSVFPEPGVLARAVPRYLSEYTSRLLATAGVQLHPNRIVTRVQEGSGGKVMVHLDNNEVLEADHVLVATGIQPNTSVFAEAGLEIDPKNGGIVTNSELEARNDVFVAGDVLSYYAPVLGRRRVEHYDHASASGYHAGLCMTGMRKPFGYISMLWSDIGSTGFEAVGDLDSSLDTVAFWDRVGINAQGAPWYFNSPPATPVDYGKGVVYYLKNKRVVGVLLWNVHGQIPACRQIIASQKQLSAEELKDAIKF